MLWNCSELHTEGYEIIDIKDLKPFQLAKDCEHVNEVYTQCYS